MGKKTKKLQPYEVAKVVVDGATLRRIYQARVHAWAALYDSDALWTTAQHTAMLADSWRLRTINVKKDYVVWDHEFEALLTFDGKVLPDAELLLDLTTIGKSAVLGSP